MILTATQIKRGGRGARNLARHLLDKLDENESVRLVVGTRDDFETYMQSGETARGIRHVAINDGRMMSEAEAWHVINLWRTEFRAFDRPITVVEHEKRLSDATPSRHFHVAIPEVWEGRRLDDRFWKIRQEKVERLAEWELGRPLTCGRHNRAVADALERDGRHDVAAAVRQLIDRSRPREAFSSAERQRAKREGVDLAAARAAVAQAFENARAPRELIKMLARDGFKIKRGKKAWIVLDKDEHFIGALHRLARVKKKAVEDLMNRGRKNDGRTADTARRAENRARDEARHGRNLAVACGGRRRRRGQPDNANIRDTGANRDCAAAAADAARKYRKYARIIAAAKINARIRAHGRFVFMLRQVRADALDLTNASSTADAVEAQLQAKSDIEDQLEREGWRVPTIRH